MVTCLYLFFLTYKYVLVVNLIRSLIHSLIIAASAYLCIVPSLSQQLGESLRNQLTHHIIPLVRQMQSIIPDFGLDRVVHGVVGECGL